jgi:hypothetical protein
VQNEQPQVHESSIESSIESRAGLTIALQS